MSLKRYLFYYMESINDDRDFHQLIVAPLRDTFCEVFLKSSQSKPVHEQGQMVEKCCAEKINKSERFSLSEERSGKIKSQ